MRQNVVLARVIIILTPVKLKQVILSKVLLDLVMRPLDEHVFESGQLIQIGRRWRRAKRIAIVPISWSIAIQIRVKPTVTCLTISRLSVIT